MSDALDAFVALGALPDAQPADHRRLAVARRDMAWVLTERGAGRSAKQCLEGDAAQGVPDFEPIFAHAALALGQNARGELAAARRRVHVDQAPCRAAFGALRPLATS